MQIQDAIRKFRHSAHKTVEIIFKFKFSSLQEHLIVQQSTAPSATATFGGFLGSLLFDYIYLHPCTTEP